MKTLLFEALSTLDTAERRAFGRFVRSPFFNLKPQLAALYDYLADCIAHNTPPDATEAIKRIKNNTPSTKVGRKPVAPKMENDDTVLRLANSGLLALLEQFFMYQEKFSDAGAAKIKLAAAYRKRNLAKHFQITLREAKADREKQAWRHGKYYQELNQIEWEQYQWDSTAVRTEALNIQNTSDLMDTAFVIQKLRLACLALSHKAVYRTDYDLGLLDHMLQAVENSPLAKVPAVELYLLCYRLLQGSDADASFSLFKKCLLEYANLFPEDELRTLYLLAINFGIKKINERRPGSQRDTLDLYQSALERKLLLENGYISRFAFSNIVGIALQLKELAWAEQFVLHYKPFLEKQYRESTSAFCLARVAYARQRFGDALLQLQNTSDRDVMTSLQAKTLQLKIYYETGEFEALESHLTGMKTYIRRKAGIGYHRDNYLRIVGYAQKLMHLNFAQPKTVRSLREKIEAEQGLTEKEWLLQQLG